MENKILLTQVISNYWPDNCLCFAFLIVVDQPVTETHQSNGPESWAIALWTSPCTIESRAIDLEFGFSKSQTLWQESARRVRNSLQFGLSVDVVPDVWQQSRISEDKLIDEHLQGES